MILNSSNRTCVIFRNPSYHKKKSWKEDLYMYLTKKSLCWFVTKTLLSDVWSVCCVRECEWGWEVRKEGAGWEGGSGWVVVTLGWYQRLNWWRRKKLIAIIFFNAQKSFHVLKYSFVSDTNFFCVCFFRYWMLLWLKICWRKFSIVFTSVLWGDAFNKHNILI